MPIIGNLLLSIGAMKAGTSWLYMLLRDHPQIDAVPLKEIHYFAQHHTDYRLLNFADRLSRLQEVTARLPTNQPDEARALLDWFRAYLAEPVNDAWLAGLYRDPQGPSWCAEFSNLNALLPQAGWQHVRRTARRVRVLYTLRNPLERLWSHTRFHLAFIGDLAQLGAMTKADFNIFLTQPEISAHGRYARVIRTLKQNLNREEYLITTCDEIEEAPRDVLAGIEAFLGICPGTYDVCNLRERHNRGPSYLMPQAFLSAARPIVEAELTSLEARGFEVPAAWLKMSFARTPEITR